jgi:regulatory protein
VTRQGSAPASLKAQAIRLLARREYARAELEQKLLAKGWDKGELSAALNELAALGYLSDARYARALARQKAGRYSRRSIAAALKAKGVDAPAIAAALSEADIDDAEALNALWARRFGRAPADEREKARQVRFLEARGFAISAILKLLRGVARSAPR